jgi:CheY-like chemotaxis protein
MASSGAEAIEKVKREDLDIVLMDCQMPEMTGQQATIEIRLLEASHKAALPVVAISANASDLDRQSCKQAGMNDFIAKPARLHTLKAVLENQFR